MSQSGSVSHKYELEGSPARFSNFLDKEPRAPGCWKFKVSNTEGAEKVCKVTAEQFSSKWAFALHVICHPFQWGDWGRALWHDKDVRLYLQQEQTKSRIMAAPPVDRLDQKVKSRNRNWGVVSIAKKGIAIFSTPFLSSDLGAIEASVCLTLIAKCDPQVQKQNPDWAFLEEVIDESLRTSNGLPEKLPSIPRLSLSDDRKSITLSLPATYLDRFREIDGDLQFSAPDKGRVQARIELSNKALFLKKMEQWGLLDRSLEKGVGSEAWWNAVLIGKKLLQPKLEPPYEPISPSDM
jgi:hypothetical protein